MLKKHGCTVPWVPDPILCTAENRKGTQDEVVSTYKVFMGETTELCPMPCSNMKFVIGQPDISDQVTRRC